MVFYHGEGQSVVKGQRCAALYRQTRVHSGRCMTPPWLPGPCMALKEVAGREPTFPFVFQESWGAERAALRSCRIACTPARFEFLGYDLITLSLELHLTNAGGGAGAAAAVLPPVPLPGQGAAAAAVPPHHCRCAAAVRSCQLKRETRQQMQQQPMFLNSEGR